MTPEREKEIWEYALRANHLESSKMIAELLAEIDSLREWLIEANEAKANLYAQISGASAPKETT